MILASSVVWIPATVVTATFALAIAAVATIAAPFVLAMSALLDVGNAIFYNETIGVDDSDSGCDSVIGM